jgi:hypothetical protein
MLRNCWSREVFFCSSNFWKQLGRILSSWGPSSQKLLAINREKRCLDQEGIPGLGVNGSCKVELYFRSEKEQLPVQGIFIFCTRKSRRIPSHHCISMNRLVYFKVVTIDEDRCYAYARWLDLYCFFFSYFFPASSGCVSLFTGTSKVVLHEYAHNDTRSC